MMSYDYPHPVSRTYQYKKITKPLLERKRRARINRCLDELKDLMVDALETEGENISKLEKADILELTVRHLQRLQASRPSGLSTSAIPGEDSSESRWRSGFGHCAAEACRFLTALPGEAADRLARHLASGLQASRQLEVQVPQKVVSSPPLSPMTSRSPLLSPTLANLDKTAKLLVRSMSPGMSSSGSASPSPGRRSISPRGSLHPYNNCGTGGKPMTVNGGVVVTDRAIGVGNSSSSFSSSSSSSSSPCRQVLGVRESSSVENRHSIIGKSEISSVSITGGATSAELSKAQVAIAEQKVLMVPHRIPTVDDHDRKSNRPPADDLGDHDPHHDVESVALHADDDEEIDVENIDDSDPMWRPW